MTTTPRSLSENEGITTAAISQWLKPLIEKGVLVWCDVNGAGFSSIAELERAKRIGRAYVKVAEKPCLPSPYQVTGDARWDSGGEFWELYDLEIEEGDEVSGDAVVLPEIKAKDCAGENSVPLDMVGGVKALSEKTGDDNNFQNKKLDPESIPVNAGSLSEGFRDLLQMN